MGLELNKVYIGDSMRLLDRVAAQSVDLVFADPPFNIGYKYDLYNDKRSCKEYLAWSEGLDVSNLRGTQAVRHILAGNW